MEGIVHLDTHGWPNMLKGWFVWPVPVLSRFAGDPTFLARNTTLTQLPVNSEWYQATSSM